MSSAAPGGPGVASYPAVDPVCRARVDAGSQSGPTHEHGGAHFQFCSERCRRRFQNEPERYLKDETPTPADAFSARYACLTCPGVETSYPATCPSCGAELVKSGPDQDGTGRAIRSMTWRLLLAMALGIPLLVLGMADRVFTDRAPVAATLGYRQSLILQAILCTPVVFICGWPFFVRAWHSVHNRRPDMFTLIGVGVGAAYVYSLAALAYELSGATPLVQQHDVAASAEVGRRLARQVETIAPYQQGTVEPFFESAAWIVILVLLGQVIELRARRQTGESVRRLMRLAPTTARVILPGRREEDLPLDLIRVGDLVKIHPGERVPVDGMVTEGTTHIDESMLTGEPLRVGKGPGLKVMAGTENGLGTIVVRVSQTTGRTLLAQVAALIARAQQTRVPLQSTVDRIAGWFVPLVLVIAAATFAGWWAFGPPDSAISYAVLCAVAVLIIACPCALGLAAPMAIVVGMGRAARSGVLFRDAAALERLALVDLVLFDKTGTLTEGKPKLAHVITSIGPGEDEVLAAAAAVERGNEHPIGLAIVWEAARRDITIPVAENVESVPGQGVYGIVNGERITVGRLGFFQQSGPHREILASEANSLRIRGETVVYVGRGDRCIGLISLSDSIRATVREAIDMMRGDGLGLALITGDHADTARAVARNLGIEEVEADTLPANKYAVVQRHKNEGRVVAMCGDGINDAPALAAADVGIAMGSGTEVAMTAAAVTLIRPDLRAIVPARNLSRKTTRTIRQNLALAFVYNALAIPVAAGVLVPLGGGLISPVWAAAAMSLSSLSVIVNSLRLRRA